MSRIGKIVSLAILRQEFPQTWSQERIIGLVVHEGPSFIIILKSDSKTTKVDTNHIMEISETL